MRTITFIIILLLQGASLFASAGGALSAGENYITNNSEEVTASWERDSEAILMGERILADFKNNREERFTLNSWCSPDSIMKIVRLRKLAADIISSSEENSGSGSAVLIAGVILENIAEVSFTPLTNRECMLVRIAGRTIIFIDNFYDKGISTGQQPIPEYAVSLPVSTMSVPTVLKLTSSHGKKRVTFPSSGNIIISKDFFDREFADLYRLFFYVRDNSGNGKPYNITYNTVLNRSHRFLFYSTRFKNTSITNTKILSSGASS